MTYLHHLHAKVQMHHIRTLKLKCRARKTVIANRKMIICLIKIAITKKVRRIWIMATEIVPRIKVGTEIIHSKDVIIVISREIVACP